MAKGETHKSDRRRRRKQRADGTGAARPPVEHWKEQPDGHDFPAAHDYLSLVLPDRDAGRLVGSLKAAPLVHRKAKDLLRASRLPLLGPDDPHVASDLAKVRHGDRLSPVLLVAGDLFAGAPLTVADGYHRVCASFHLDEDADIPCRIVPSVTVELAPRTGAGRRSAASPSAGLATHRGRRGTPPGTA